MKLKDLIFTLILFSILPSAQAMDGRQWIQFMFSPKVSTNQGKSQKAFTALASLAVIANSADYFSTRYAIAHGAVEANPGMAPLYSHEPAAAAYKLGLVNMGLVTSAKRFGMMTGKKRVIGYVLLSAETGLFFWATAHNIRVARNPAL
jgi:hypothetical protein